MNTRHDDHELIILRPWRETRYLGFLQDGTRVQAERLGPWLDSDFGEAPIRALPEHPTADDLCLQIGNGPTVTIACEEEAPDRPWWPHKSAGLFLAMTDLPRVYTGGRYSERPLWLYIAHGAVDLEREDLILRTIWHTDSSVDDALAYIGAEVLEDPSGAPFLAGIAEIRRDRMSAAAAYFEGEVQRSIRYLDKARQKVAA